MGIRLQDEDLAFTLDWALGLARSESPLPRLWTERTERFGVMGVKTYIAALGGALLTKATDARVDSLAQDESAGPRGYSLRRSTEFLATHNDGRFHLGAEGRWPLNNRPFLGGPSRIDEFTKIAPRARPAFELFLDSLIDLNRLEQDEALHAFAAYLRVRIAVAREQLRAAKAELMLESQLNTDVLLGICERYIQEDPEGGRRGQAFVAAAFDCVFPSVHLLSINDPSPGDVRVMAGEKVRLAVEVKQAPVSDTAAIELAREAKSLGAEAGLLVVLAQKHAPLDRESIRRSAVKETGLFVETCESVREFLGALAVFTGGSTADLCTRLPAAYAARMAEHDVSKAGQQRWRDLIAARSASSDPR